MPGLNDNRKKEQNLGWGALKETEDYKQQRREKEDTGTSESGHGWMGRLLGVRRGCPIPPPVFRENTQLETDSLSFPCPSHTLLPQEQEKCHGLEARLVPSLPYTTFIGQAHIAL